MAKPKPTQYEIDCCREVLEYCIADTQQNEPHAMAIIETWEEALSQIPNEDELGEVDD